MNLSAGEQVQPKKGSLRHWVSIELLLGGSSAIAAKRPHEFGSISIVTGAWAYAEVLEMHKIHNENLLPPLLGLLAVQGTITVRNLRVDLNDYNKQRVFNENFLAWQLIMAGAWLSSFSDHPRNSWQLIPLPQASLFTYQVQFW